jgi:hypothetical protein
MSATKHNNTGHGVDYVGWCDSPKCLTRTPRTIIAEDQIYVKPRATERNVPVYWQGPS